MYQRKTIDEYIVQGNYGYGWDDLTTEASMKDAKATLHTYVENEKGAAHRIIKRRVRKEACVC